MAAENIDAPGEDIASEAWRRGLASAGALVAAILLIGLVVLVSHSNRDRDAALVRERHSYDIVLVTRALDSSMARSEAALGRFVISGDRNTGALFLDEWRRARRQLTRLEQLTRDNPVQAALVARLIRLYDARGRELFEPATRANFRQGWPALSLFNEAGKSATIPAIDDIVSSLLANERALLRARSERAEHTAERSNTYAALLSAIGVLLTLGAMMLAWTAIRAMRERRMARRAALRHEERADTLEAAVAARTRELSEANEALRAEAETREAAEAQLRQVQKMEAVGQLTGGIAHDFNNMLAVVVGGLDLARRRLHHGAEEVGRHIDNAMEGANRAAALTRRLLAFARAEPLLPEGIDPARLIAGMSDLLDRTLGERVRVVTRDDTGGWRVWCDPSQLENAILNLCVNARDAMDDEGVLTISTAAVTLVDNEVGEARGGDYVRISVNDNGAGMPPEVIERVFEPFFTTKPVGKGTGLGLSQIFGFIRQSEGEIEIASTVGEGTTVTLYLPRSTYVETHGQRHVDERPVIAPADTAGATILVVEDDPRVRTATVGALEELGYRPIACESGDAALALLEARSDIRLLITDVVMPGMTGPELVARLAARGSALGVLFVTGYVGDAGDAAQFSDHDVLRKPFTVAALERAVAAALTRAVSAPPATPAVAATRRARRVAASGAAKA